MRTDCLGFTFTALFGLGFTLLIVRMPLTSLNQRAKTFIRHRTIRLVAVHAMGWWKTGFRVYGPSKSRQAICQVLPLRWLKQESHNFLKPTMQPWCNIESPSALRIRTSHHQEMHEPKPKHLNGWNAVPLRFIHILKPDALIPDHGSQVR